MRTIRIATRPSALAMAQARQVAALLAQANSGLVVEIVPISTRGDIDQRDFTKNPPAVGFFTGEVEQSLLDGRADIAVHSYKDLPASMSAELVVAAVPQRGPVADVIVAHSPLASLDDLPGGSRIGTSSPRRAAQILHFRSDLRVMPIRGNVETRIAKLDGGQYDAIVLAHAGLARLGLQERISLILRPQDFLPAPAQGSLAVQCRRDDEEVFAAAARLDDRASRAAADAERAVLAALQGGCSIPLGVSAFTSATDISVQAVLLDTEGRQAFRACGTALIADAAELAAGLAGDILQQGGKELLAQMRG